MHGRIEKSEIYLPEEKSKINLPELLPNSLKGWVINKTQEQNSFRLSIVLTFV